MQKTNIPGIYKVTEGVLINKDNEALHMYKRKKQALKRNDERMDNIDNRIDNLSKDLEEIKSLLRDLVAK